MGVVEHTFSIPSGSNRGVEWRIYDVGGARNQRQAWAPYFEDGTQIFSIFSNSNIEHIHSSQRDHLPRSDIRFRPGKHPRRDGLFWTWCN